MSKRTSRLLHDLISSDEPETSVFSGIATGCAKHMANKDMESAHIYAVMPRWSVDFQDSIPMRVVFIFVIVVRFLFSGAEFFGISKL